MSLTYYVLTKWENLVKQIKGETQKKTYINLGFVPFRCVFLTFGWNLESSFSFP